MVRRGGVWRGMVGLGLVGYGKAWCGLVEYSMVRIV